MPDLRYDPIASRWVIIAANRANRPLEFSRPEVRSANQVCPFCPGNEDQTPNEVARFSVSGERQRTPTSTLDHSLLVQDPWQVRVVPNLYPALDSDSNSNDLDPVDRIDSHPSQSEVFHQHQATGKHQVIIESPEHHSTLTQISGDGLRTVFRAYRDRFRAAAKDPRILAALLFKNNGVAAGISLEHVHSQFVAFPFVPKALREELDGAFQWYSRHKKCVFCHVLEEEISIGERIVFQSDRLVAFCPFASRFPYEVWLLPKQHQPLFHAIDDDLLDEASLVYRQILSTLELNVKNVSYNCLFHSAPFDSFCYDHYHWHIEIIPRIATTAGLEWGSGVHVNIVSPEQSALLLRSG